MAKSHDGLRKCKTCKQRKSLPEFGTSRFHICLACRSRGNKPPPRSWIGVEPPSVDPTWHRVEIWANGGEVIGPMGPEKVPALTMTAKGWNKYCRERSRAASRARVEASERLRAAKGLSPKVTPLDAKPRKCLHCKRMLALSYFDGPRVRICIQCDGPSLGF